MAYRSVFVGRALVDIAPFMLLRSLAKPCMCACSSARNQWPLSMVLVGEIDRTLLAQPWRRVVMV